MESVLNMIVLGAGLASAILGAGIFLGRLSSRVDGHDDTNKAQWEEIKMMRQDFINHALKGE